MPNIKITKVNQIKDVESYRGTLVKKHNYFTGVSTDTRTVKKGQLFFALKGDRFDGHNFLEKAFENGACGAVVDKTHKKLLIEKLFLF